jgi:hypothetical protein
MMSQKKKVKESKDGATSSPSTKPKLHELTEDELDACLK